MKHTFSAVHFPEDTFFSTILEIYPPKNPENIRCWGLVPIRGYLTSAILICNFQLSFFSRTKKHQCRIKRGRPQGAPLHSRRHCDVYTFNLMENNHTRSLNTKTIFLHTNHNSAYPGFGPGNPFASELNFQELLNLLS